MLIKQQALTSFLQKKLAAVYILLGQETFFIDKAAEAIKSSWQAANNHEVEETILQINNAADWALLDAKANSYSLFFNSILIDIRYEKKTMDPAVKAFFNRYLQDVNPRCLLLFNAPNISTKQLQWLINESNVHAIQINPLSDAATQSWISEELQKKALKFEPQIPALIHQYTQGNMYACAQAIKKLELIAEASTILTTKLVQDQLVDQCEYQLFELADACLSRNPNKAIQLLRHAANDKTEPALVLWLLTQEIRLLTQLMELTTNQSLSFNNACKQLKIWPQRTKLYQLSLGRVQLARLFQLLQFCKIVDERIKSNQDSQIWSALEQIAMALSN